MNVIVSNKQKNIIDNANIDAIKDLNGFFNVDDLVNKFKNYFFSKMILDATSVVDFTSDAVLNKLAKDIGSERLVILLPASPEPPKEFTDKLINLGIYNFSNKIEDIVQFLDESKSYGNGVENDSNTMYSDNKINDNTNNSLMDDVPMNMPMDDSSEYQNSTGRSYSDMLSNFDIQENSSDNTNDLDNQLDNTNISNIEDNANEGNSIENPNNMVEFSNVDIDRIDDNSQAEYDANNLNLPNDNHGNTNETVNENMIPNNVGAMEVSSSSDVNPLTNPVIQNKNDNNLVQPNTMNEMNIIPSNDNNNINNNNINNNNNMYLEQKTSKKIIGIRNVTKHAGSTTLTYLLVNVLREKYKRRVSAIEINKNDFKYYLDNKMISISAVDVNNVINNNDEIIIVDLNDCHDISFCTDVLYLVEPSIIKLNRLMMENRFAFRELQNNKIILNKSLLSENDIINLTKEAGVVMFMNIPPLNDRINNQVIDNLINKLGLN